MQERTFLLLAVLWSLIGLFILILLVNFAQPSVLQISDLEENVGKIVQLDNLAVASVSYKTDTVFLTLEDPTGKMSAVYFDKPKFDLLKGDLVSVRGKVQLYKGNLEIVIQELICLSC
jgi:DNA/RNA endonuclease YhcR with UshA esterase domain